MGLFSRKPPEPKSDPSHWIGRKFRSGRTLDECLATFSKVKDECYQTTGALVDVEWTVPASLGSFTSTQGSNVTVKPARVVASDLVGGRRIYLALWDGTVSYGDHTGTGGPPCEMWFVPPGFDTSPIAIAGTWKMQDASLSSIGWVESPMWGTTKP